jgi:hypothetical protein
MGYPLLFMGLIVVPGCLIYVFIQKRSTLESPEFLRKWGSCYADISLRNMWTRAYYLFNIFRRFCYVTLGLFVKEPIYQICGVLALNLIIAMYYGSVRPLTNRFDNRLEMLNEYIMNLCCMHLIFFTPEISIERQQTYGWSLVYTVGLMCSINLLVMFFELARYLMLLVVR